MVKVALLVVICMAAVAAHAEAAVSCGQVVSSLTPCINYVTKGGPLPAACCSGIKTLNGQATTTPDRQAACNCIKSAAGSISGINFGIAAGLPGKCGVNLPYKISPSIDCSTVQ
ncbi:non-specific lipid-transfer protein 1-like [Lycium barbarum]|uniref:non-specific lipid-transfer protein 1-like n=1 Tax=Lycium barbarum TaxID=112863 RepID=UPI00293F50A2|nr:non-specific lipid-transfer protein 1-like [Lycium barbarum]XP_060197994.1 non-specific lipid-transfer protein 1-like [Lycium barbarum]